MPGGPTWSRKGSMSTLTPTIVAYLHGKEFCVVISAANLGFEAHKNRPALHQQLRP